MHKLGHHDLVSSLCGYSEISMQDGIGGGCFKIGAYENKRLKGLTRQRIEGRVRIIMGALQSTEVYGGYFSVIVSVTNFVDFMNSLKLCVFQ